MAEKLEEIRDPLAIEDVEPEVTQSSTENVMIVHQHHHHHDNRTVVQGNIYHGGEFKGDIMTSKTEVKDATIGAIGAPMSDPRHHKRDPLAISAPETQLALPWRDPGQQSEYPIQGMVDHPALPWPERRSPGSTASSSDPGELRRHLHAIGGAESRPDLPWSGLERHPRTSETPLHQALPWPEDNPGMVAGKDDHQRRSPVNKGRDAALPWHDDLTRPKILEATCSHASPPSEEDETHGEESCRQEEDVEHQRGAESLSPGHHEGGHQTMPTDTGTSSKVGQQRRQVFGARPKHQTPAMQRTRSKDPSKYLAGSRESQRSSGRESMQRRGRSETSSPPFFVGTTAGLSQTWGRNDMGEEEDYQEDIINLLSEDSNEQSQEYIDSEVDKDIERIISREKHREMASRPISRLRDVQTSTEVTITYNAESQTTRKITRERMIQTETEPKFDTESQTDNPLMRERMSQTELLSTVESVTQTIDYSETKEKIRIQAPTETCTQTEPKIVSESDTQTNVTELSDTQTQTDVKAFDDNGFQTDGKEMTTSSIQTDITATSNVESQTAHNESDLLPRVISAFKILTAGKAKKDIRLKFINLFNKEDLEIKDEFKERYLDLLELISAVWSTILTRLMTKICEYFQGRWNQTENALADLCLLNLRQISEQNVECQRISQFAPLAKVVLQMGKEFASNKKYIHALVSYYTAAKLYKLSNNGDYSVLGINTCSRQTILLVVEIAEQDPMTGIIIGHVIEFMRKMIDFIRSIQNSTHAARITSEAKCLYRIGICFFYCGEFQQFASKNKSAIEFLETDFKENAKEYNIYGHCLFNDAFAYESMGNITNAIELYERALKAYESAKDWDSEEQKLTETKRTEENLKIANLKKIVKYIFE